MQPTVFTIGHSTHLQEYFISLLSMHGITALCDVRSKPYSRINPQFNREDLKQSLREKSVAYVFLGKEHEAKIHPAMKTESCSTSGWRNPPSFSRALNAYRRE